jgi:hypothetical protein
MRDVAQGALTSYLDHRRSRWPNTQNPHLLISQQTAVELGEVSSTWHKIHMKPRGITLTELRRDRLLDEVTAHGPDPLHFQAVFGCSKETALKYLRLAEHLFSDDPRFQTKAGQAT